MTDEGRAVPVDAADSATSVPGHRVVHLDQHPSRGGTRPESSGLFLARQGFQRRVVDYLATDAGIRQFVDLGSLLPAGNGIQDVAGSGEPGVRTVYVDAWSARPARGQAPHDPAVPVVVADSMRPSPLVERLAECGLVDFAEPVAVLLLETAALRRDEVRPRELAWALHARMCSGSHVAIALDPDDIEDGVAPEEAFGPLSVLEPGMADIAWWPYPDDEVAVEGTGVRAGVGRRG